MQNEITSRLDTSAGVTPPPQLQTFRVAVDQAVVIRKGLAAPSNTADIELDLNLLTSAEHEWLARRFRAGEIRRTPTGNDLLAIAGGTQDDLVEAIRDTCAEDALKEALETTERSQREAQCMDLIKVYKADDLFDRFITRETEPRFLTRYNSGIQASVHPGSGVECTGWFVYINPPHPPYMHGNKVYDMACSARAEACSRLTLEVQRRNEAEFGKAVDLFHAGQAEQARLAEKEKEAEMEERREVIRKHGTDLQRFRLERGMIDVEEESQRLLNRTVMGERLPRGDFPRSKKPTKAEVATACDPDGLLDTETVQVVHRTGKLAVLTDAQAELLLKVEAALPPDAEIVPRWRSSYIEGADDKEMVTFYLKATVPHGRLKAAAWIQMDDNPDLDGAHMLA